MTVGGGANHDIYNLSDLDDLRWNFSDETESGLCVPLDPIESLGWLPTFSNNPISFHDLDLNTKSEILSDDDFFLEKKRPSLQDLSRVYPDFAKKKQRSQRASKQSAWSLNGGSFAADDEEEVNEEVVQRRCSHCQTGRTPQWRMGPLGPKTLCNACGVRYKSGRLVPEYRPAASPTFNSFKHSNFHRKIMKIRGGDEVL